MTGKFRLVVGFAAGYLMGAKAGRERYDQIMRQVKELWERPEVQDMAAKGRETLGQGAQRGAGVATDQMERVRSAMSSSQHGGAEPARGADTAAKASGNDETQRQRSSSMPGPDGEEEMRGQAGAMRRQGKQPPPPPA